MQRQPSIDRVFIRAAVAPDLPQIVEMLRGAGLIGGGVEEQLGAFLIAADGERVIGSAGLEVYGDVALLRSVAVDEGLRGQGLGRRLVTAAVAHARRLGVREGALLTTSAAPFFRRLGFREAERQALDPRLTASQELGDECCATAVVMMLRMRPREDTFGAVVSAEGPGSARPRSSRWWARI